VGAASGVDIHVTDDIVDGAVRPLSNVGISLWNQYLIARSGIEVAGTQVKCSRSDGMRIRRGTRATGSPVGPHRPEQLATPRWTRQRSS
jgi:hypothetical protein